MGCDLVWNCDSGRTGAGAVDVPAPDGLRRRRVFHNRVARARRQLEVHASNSAPATAGRSFVLCELQCRGALFSVLVWAVEAGNSAAHPMKRVPEAFVSLLLLAHPTDVVNSLFVRQCCFRRRRGEMRLPRRVPALGPVRVGVHTSRERARASSFER
ncbi:hypothetical protein PybrP1_010543, partial [[Pythium] brassicae (nom. inval.)]